jgi:hypothetical protein
VLGALCDLTAQVLAVLPTVQLAEMPRMADWSRLLAALDQVTGWTTAEHYRQAPNNATAAVLDASPLAGALRALALKAGGTWTGTPTELHTAITPDPRPRGWPANPGVLSGKVNRLAPALRATGVHVERDKGSATVGGRKTFTIRTRPPESSGNSVASVAPDPPSP